MYGCLDSLDSVSTLPGTNCIFFRKAEWQLYLVLVGMILLSGLLFLLFFKSSLSDDFWQLPMGRIQPAQTPEPEWCPPSNLDDTCGL